MGLFGSLFTGVSALFAQSQNTAIISNNIANVNTTGFKRSEASFDSLVTTQSRSSIFSPGTVSVNRIQRVNQQGSIQQTSSSTDAAISGNGFFPVKRSTDFGQEFLYTRAGQFSEDSQGLLRNASGYVLYAWPIDQNGDLPANQGDLTSLVPADVAFLGGLTRPTTEAELAINLDADQTDYINDQFTTPSVLPIPSTQPAHFSRGLTVFDSLGSPQTITFEYRKIIGPMAHFTTDITQSIDSDDTIAGNAGAGPGFLDSIDENDALTIEVDGTSESFEFVDAAGNGTLAGANEIVTIQDYIDALNAFDGGGVLEARLISGQVVVQAVDPTESVEVTNHISGTRGTPATDLGYITDVQGYQELSTATYASAAVDLDTAADVDAAEEFTIALSDGTSRTYRIGAGGAVDANVTTVQDLIDDINANFTGLSASFVDGRIQYEKDDPDLTLTFTDDTGDAATGNNGVGISGTGFLYEPEAPISPTGSGTNYSTNDPYPNQNDFPQFSNTSSPNTQGWWEVTILDPDGVALTTGLINFDGDGGINASANSDGDTEITLENINWFNGSELQDIDIDVSRFSQFSGNYDVIFSDQNGAELGLRTGVELTREGVVVARFSNGASADLYKVPLGTFANPNGLTEVSGTAYTESEESGEENLREAGQGGAGFVQPSTLEASNVDLADEFAKLIVAQRAFSAGTKIIDAANQSTQELLRIV